MDITAMEAIDAVWQRLKAANLTISGAIYKTEKPAGSVKEDIVINALPITAGDIQFGILNVNIHPVKTVYTVGGVSNTSFDWNRLITVVKAVKAALSMEDELWTEDYHFNVQQEGLLPDELYYNIRLEFFNENILN